MKHVKAFISLILMLFAVIIIVENLEQLSRALTLKIDLLFGPWKVRQWPFTLF